MFFRYFIIVLFLSLPKIAFVQNNFLWKVGTSTINITPKQSMWMGGYASRDHPSEGIRQDIFIKAIAFEDSKGQRGYMVSMDLVSIPKEISDNIRNQLAAKFNISSAQIILNVTHTHTGPELLGYYWDLSSDEIEKIKTFVTDLETKVVNLIDEAIKDLEPARLFSGNGIVRFQVNRRNNKEHELTNYKELLGPNDYSVPVIKAINGENQVKVILFSYACHGTVLNDYLFSGDYMGYAEKELELIYPGVNALFFQAAAGDQNPLPRREPELAEQYGRELAAAVDRILKSKMKDLTAKLLVSYSEIDIPMKNAPPSSEELKSIINGEGNFPEYLKNSAKVLLNQINNGQKLLSKYPYPVQVWTIGEQPIFAFGGELLIGYTIELKRIFGDDIFVFGYCNDVMGYIPTVTVLREGGYEVIRSPYFTNPWDENIEYLIIKEAKQLAKTVGIDKNNFSQPQ